MIIEILGDGCAKCNELKNKVHQAIGELGIAAEVVSVMDPLRLADLKTRSLPQLAIDGEIPSSADLSRLEGVKGVISAAHQKH